MKYIKCFDNEAYFVILSNQSSLYMCYASLPKVDTFSDKICKAQLAAFLLLNDNSENVKSLQID